MYIVQAKPRTRVYITAVLNKYSVFKYRLKLLKMKTSGIVRVYLEVGFYNRQ